MYVSSGSDDIVCLSYETFCSDLVDTLLLSCCTEWGKLKSFPMYFCFPRLCFFIPCIFSTVLLPSFCHTPDKYWVIFCKLNLEFLEFFHFCYIRDVGVKLTLNCAAGNKSWFFRLQRIFGIIDHHKTCIHVYLIGWQLIDWVCLLMFMI